MVAAPRRSGLPRRAIFVPLKRLVDVLVSALRLAAEPACAASGSIPFLTYRALMALPIELCSEDAQCTTYDAASLTNGPRFSQRTAGAGPGAGDTYSRVPIGQGALIAGAPDQLYLSVLIRRCPCQRVRRGRITLDVARPRLLGLACPPDARKRGFLVLCCRHLRRSG